MPACGSSSLTPPPTAMRLRACFDMTTRRLARRPPGRARLGLRFVRRQVGPRLRHFAPADVARDVTTLASRLGGYMLRLPDTENTSMAFCILIVPPAARRAGVGRALLAHCADQARRAGRSRLAGTARDGSPGAAFAAAAGARAGIAEVNRVLTVDSAFPARLSDLRAIAEKHSAGYSLVSWRAPAPAEYLDQLGLIHSAMADAPRDAGVEPHVWDAARIRHLEQTMAEHQLTCYAIAARHDATGELVALTEMAHRGRNAGLGVPADHRRPGRAPRAPARPAGEGRHARAAAEPHARSPFHPDRERRSKCAHDRDQRAARLRRRRCRPRLGLPLDIPDGPAAAQS